MKPASILFIGDSLMAYHDWSGRFNDSVNHGMPGATLGDLRERIGAFLQQRPRCIVLMIGINDLMQNRSVDAMKEDYLALFNALRPCNETFMLSLLPVIADAATQRINENVVTLNHWLKAEASQRRFTYVDLYRHTVDKKLGLREAYTVDGVHLNESGYRIFEKTLLPYLL